MINEYLYFVILCSYNTNGSIEKIKKQLSDKMVILFLSSSQLSFFALIMAVNLN